MTDSAKPKKIIDVVHPNHSAPSDTSRPVIVNNRPILRDPMMSIELTSDNKPADDSALQNRVSTKINIQPISDDKTDEIDTRVEDEPVIEKEVEPVLPVKPVVEDTTEPVPPEIKPVDNSENDIEAVNQLESKTEHDKSVIDAEIQEKHEAELDGLVENKDYFLPINTATQKRTKNFVVIGVVVSILLVAVWVDLALDAGLIKIGGFKALTHIFST